MVCQRLLVAADYFHMTIYEAEQPVVQLPSYQDHNAPSRVRAGLHGERKRAWKRMGRIRVPKQDGEPIRLLTSFLYQSRQNTFQQVKTAKPAYFKV